MANRKSALRPASHWMCLVAIAIAGCNSGDGKLPVRGTVKFEDGTPVTGDMAAVLFTPDSTSNNPGKRPASGTIDSDGNFELMTQESGDGAYPGDYKVALNVWKEYRNQVLGVPKEYSDAATTPLRANVSSDQRNFDFIVKQ